MTEPTRYQTKPVELPVGMDAWLFDCAPVHGCDVCAALYRQRASAIEKDDRRTAYRTSSEIRDHPASHGLSKLDGPVP